MEFSDYVRTIRRHALTIAAVVLIGAMAGFLFARTSAPLYKSASSIFVSANRGENTSDLVQGSVYTQNLMQSYAKLAQTPSVLNPVISRLKLDMSAAELGHKVSADAPLNTVIVVITVTDESPRQAAAIANAVTDQLSIVARQLSPKYADGSPGISLSQVGKATPAAAPFSPNTSLLVVAGAGLGLLLILGMVVARHLIERRIHTESDLKSASSKPIVGKVPPSNQPRSILGRRRVGSRDSFLRLADRVSNTPGKAGLRSVVVTSAGNGDGKTHVACNLAMAMSEFHGRVLLVDSNFRSPTVETWCGLPSSAGLSDVIQARATVDESIVAWRGIWVLTAGTAVQNPTRQLNSPAMAKTFIDLVRDFDFVVFDSYAVLGVADTLPLARLTDSVVLVARAGRTTRGQVVAATESISGTGGELTGIVLNGFHNRGFQRLRNMGRKSPMRRELESVEARPHTSKRSTGKIAKDRNP